MFSDEATPAPSDEDRPRGHRLSPKNDPDLLRILNRIANALDLSLDDLLVPETEVPETEDEEQTHGFDRFFEPES